jgi:conjugative transfer pilus assembly protein TraH
MKSNLQRTVSKITATLVVVIELFAMTSTEAGILDNFYNSAGAMSNITGPEAYKTQNMNVISGGSLVFRAPNRTFTPFSLTPPSLKMGCGGIDLIAGSFSMFNLKEFVDFLRNVGQNSAGLAFKVALETLAPDLESKIQDIASDINQMNRYFGNSCQAAHALMDGPASQWISDAVTEAKGYVTSMGSGTDSAAADTEMGANAGAAIANAPPQYYSNGQIAWNTQMNITWAALNSNNGDTNYDDTEKGLMMALVGTSIFKCSNAADCDPKSANPDAHPMIIPIAGDQVNFNDLIGTVQDPSTASKQNFNIYTCSDSDCLDPTISTTSEWPFAQQFYNSAFNIQQAIINRTPVDTKDLQVIMTKTSLPIYKVIAITTMPNYQYLGDNLIQNYSEAAGVELAAHYIEEIASNVQKMLKSAQTTGATKEQITALKQIDDKANQIRANAIAKRTEIYNEIAQNGTMVVQIEQIQRALYSNLAANYAANLNFGQQ